MKHWEKVRELLERLVDEINFDDDEPLHVLLDRYADKIAGLQPEGDQ